MTLEDLYRLLRSGHVQAQGVLDTLDDPLVVLDQAMTVITANPAFLRTFCTDRDDTIGYELFSLGNGQWDLPELRQLFSQVIPRAAAIVDFEVSHDFPRIGRHTFLLTARRLAHPDDNSQQILVVFNDVTKRRREMHAKDILLNESRHRMKNLLAVIRAVISQTRTQGIDADTFRQTVLGRVDGLATAHHLTMDDTQAVDLETLVRRVLLPYADRIVIRPGPSRHLPTPQVQPLGLSLHEMATNAVKYGALSVPEGRVSLSWDVSSDGEQPMVSLVWIEQDGPPVMPSGHEGFGARLIRHSISYEMNGSLDIAYESTGLKVTILFPLARDDP